MQKNKMTSDWRVKCTDSTPAEQASDWNWLAHPCVALNWLAHPCMVLNWLAQQVRPLSYQLANMHRPLSYQLANMHRYGPSVTN